MAANTDLKQEIRDKLAELREILNQQQRTLHSLPDNSNSNLPQVLAPISVPPSTNVTTNVATFTKFECNIVGECIFYRSSFAPLD
jgi:hypothetical protein